MDEVFQHDGVTVRYKFREAKQDRRHLVVAFAGVQSGRHDFYGFDGQALDHVRGAVLWIKDSFSGQNAYYLCEALNFRIEKAVAALIDSILDRLDLSPTQCTLLGGSKGGSAALHLGLKYSYRNIVASVPQTRVGTYTRQKLKDTFAYMAGAYGDTAEEILNNYLPNLIANPASHEKNIYIISSAADPEYNVHIRPNLAEFSKYTNFNLLLSDSMLVTSHPEVTPYNIPFILGTLYHLCEGLTPRFGTAQNGGGEYDRNSSRRNLPKGKNNGVPTAGMHWAVFRGEQLHFRGYAIVPGQEAATAPSEPPRLVASRKDVTREFDLVPVEDKSLNTKFYQERFYEYAGAGIGSPAKDGLSFAVLPIGTFDLAVSFKNTSGSYSARLTSAKSLTFTGFSAGHAYRLEAGHDGSTISKHSLLSAVPHDAFFDFSEIEVRDTTLFVKGIFAVPREEMLHWNDGDFALTLQGDTTITFHMASSRIRQSEIVNSALDESAHLWSNFTSPANKGFDLRSVPGGRYECYVTFVRNRRIHTGERRFNLVVTQPSAGSDPKVQLFTAV